LRLSYSFFYFQSLKLIATHTEAADFIKGIRAKKPVGEQSAESSELHKEEVFDSCEICKEVFSRTARGRETSSHCETCVTSFTQQRSATEGMRGRELRCSCDVCKRIFSCRFNLDNHTRVHTGERPFSCNLCNKKFTQICNLKTNLKGILENDLLRARFDRKDSFSTSTYSGISNCIVVKVLFRANYVIELTLNALT
jgi:hypothetical protein